MSVVFADGGEQDAAAHHASLQKVLEPFMDNPDYGITRIVLSTDGCAKQYYGKENFFRMKENTKGDFFSTGLVSFVHNIAVAGHFKGPWDGFGGGIGIVLRRIQKILQAKGDAPTRLLDAKHCWQLYTDYISEMGQSRIDQHKNDAIHALYLDKSTVKRINKAKEDTTTIAGTKMHRAFMALANGCFYVRARRCGCMECSAATFGSCVNIHEVSSPLYDNEVGC